METENIRNYTIFDTNLDKSINIKTFKELALSGSYLARHLSRNRLLHWSERIALGSDYRQDSLSPSSKSLSEFTSG